MKFLLKHMGSYYETQAARAKAVRRTHILYKPRKGRSKNESKSRAQRTDRSFDAGNAGNKERGRRATRCSRICATIREVQDLAQRIHVAKLLREHVTYHDIATQTGASTATISRVNRALVYGAGGYETVLGRLIDEKQENGSGEDK